MDGPTLNAKCSLFTEIYRRIPVVFCVLCVCCQNSQTKKQVREAKRNITKEKLQFDVEGERMCQSKRPTIPGEPNVWARAHL